MTRPCASVYAGSPNNGPELTAAVLREWCRQRSTGTAYIEPGSPWQNAYVESFNSRLRDELLNVEVFTCLDEARVLAADWREDYNANHPHSALGMMSPARFAASWQRIGKHERPNQPRALTRGGPMNGVRSGPPGHFAAARRGRHRICLHGKPRLPVPGGRLLAQRSRHFFQWTRRN